MNQSPGAWSFTRVGLIVTGETEEKCLADLFRVLTAEGICNFRVIRRVGQRSPITSETRKLNMVGGGKKIPNRDAEQIGLTARRFMTDGGEYVMLVDDLEFERSTQMSAVFDRYRRALDEMLPVNLRSKAAVHFLVNMLEAYYFDDAKALNRVLGTDCLDFDGDVETIRHPKKNLKALHPEFDEKQHGPLIVGALDVMHVLARADACSSLRTMFAWAVEAIGSSVSVPDGSLCDVTQGQTLALRQTRSI